QAKGPLKIQVTGQPATPPGAQPPAPSASTPDLPVPVVPGPTEDGRVTFIDNAVDPTTATITMKGTFPNADRMLWPGLFSRVTLFVSTEPNAIVVPAGAVQVSQDGQYVYVVKADQTVEMRPITVQRQQGDRMVIAKGLTAGETVVTDGQLRLTPGARVSERGGGPGGTGASTGSRAGKRGEY
ncbi:MAG TPA: efflux RND transporter periplasmic adaptor subunit, partial [Vicinamibacterales bacterium]